eukprot:m.14467 g.14467  ORF g.14467 m.14467 type:complete len:62 (+) comp25760_c0_seq2:121-306(+)
MKEMKDPAWSKEIMQTYAMKSDPHFELEEKFALQSQVLVDLLRHKFVASGLDEEENQAVRP